MLDQITHLFRLRTILEEGSLRRASEKLNVTQPALSRSLAQLESYFGQQLVERHARGVKATAFGERVLSISNRIERYWEIAEHELRSEVTQKKTLIRIGGGPIWRSGILAGVLSQLQQQFPGLVIEFSTLTYTRTAQQLREGQLDVAFTGLALAEGHGLERVRLTEVTNRVIAREDHPVFAAAERTGTFDSRMLLDYPWIVYSELPAYREITEHAVVQHLGRTPDVAFVCQNLLSVLTILQQSQALSVLPAMAIGAVSAPRLKPIPLLLEGNTVDVGMIFRRELMDWEPVKVLAALCEAHFGAADPV
ncbi:DNA-binding transcriptional regulator, LysR family [Devosia lucknowensis]|uniref:DNA-binding transcriptional regulator, LysR family n=1 Tax=Devosia lucknowensis TaxID=1096929 RepID=A0A1Y6G5J5_9HYPH|nr:LysR family transcriptional regulator [Devosia lucknowensis]SMQ85431.1 DNA-binding transcriptional regulator, LysR family [Devosia lucknowensis]